MELIPSILLGIVVTCTVFVYFISSLGWWKRQNLQTPDLPFLINVIAEVSSGFAKAVFCTLVFTGIFENLILLTGFGFRVEPALNWLEDSEFLGWLLAAFVCNTFHLVWTFYRQCSVDIFIVDWEHAKNEQKREGCIWRTYFVANQLLRLQDARQISPLLLFSVGYLCITLIPGILGMDSQSPLMGLSSSNSTSNTGPIVSLPHVGPYYVFTVSAVTLSVVALIIHSVVVLRDRFSGNRVREFIDVCSWLNCSVFMRTHKNFGYYIHGKSVHPTAEFGFGNLLEMIRNEEANMVRRRGLNAGSDIQSFSFALPVQFDVLYRQLITQLSLNHAAPRNVKKDDGTHISFINTPFSSSPTPDLASSAVTMHSTGEKTGRTTDKSLEDRADSHDQICRFLQHFLDHAFKEADYTIRWRNFFESFFDLENGRAPNSGVMYYDPKMTFTECFFIGRTFDFFIFEVLLFCVVAINTTMYAVGLVTVLLVGFVLSELRVSFGYSNLTKKAYVYRRFLL